MSGGYTDYRAIPLEVLRDFVRTRCELTSIRTAAAETGLSHTAIHQFANGKTKPQPRVRRLLGLWFLAKQNEPQDIDVTRPYVAALTVLLSGIPPEGQGAARRDAITALQCVYEGRAPAPRWLELLASQMAV